MKKDRKRSYRDFRRRVFEKLTRDLGGPLAKPLMPLAEEAIKRGYELNAGVYPTANAVQTWIMMRAREGPII